MTGKSEQCPRCGGYGFGCYECTPSDITGDTESTFDELKSIDSVSMLGNHDGVLDDEFLYLLAAMERKGGE